MRKGLLVSVMLVGLVGLVGCTPIVGMGTFTQGKATSKDVKKTENTRPDFYELTKSDHESDLGVGVIIEPPMEEILSASTLEVPDEEVFLDIRKRELDNEFLKQRMLLEVHLRKSISEIEIELNDEMNNNLNHRLNEDIENLLNDLNDLDERIADSDTEELAKAFSLERDRVAAQLSALRLKSDHDALVRNKQMEMDAVNAKADLLKKHKMKVAEIMIDRVIAHYQLEETQGIENKYKASIESVAGRINEYESAEKEFDQDVRELFGM